ncbi:MAG: molybdenum cofactor biosynthesis protein MoaB [Desulfobacteraceae bacterium]|nr:MAG: molybdenum cofactor biosynthesis protein MoaB [Desulfobacteraceae bacterium]
MGTREHKKNSLEKLDIAIISVSSTRSLAEDKSGKWIYARAVKEGHRVVCHKVLPDQADRISDEVTEILAGFSPHAIILTGGTGISKKDVTIEAVRPLFQKELSAFGAIFAQLSFEEIDSAAILSRATAGIVRDTVVFCIPGSIKACKLACKALIFPELGHIVKHIQDN